MPETTETKERVLMKPGRDMQTQSVRKLQASTIQGRVPRSQVGRPMLARVAESMYWMSRYIERAEHAARVVWVNFNMLIDLGDLAPTMQEKQWQGVLRILRLDNSPEAAEILKQGDRNIGQRVTEYMTLDKRNRNSLIQLFDQGARECQKHSRKHHGRHVGNSQHTVLVNSR